MYVLLNATQVATRLGISKAQAYKLMAQKTIPSFKVGEKNIRTTEEILEKYIYERINDNGIKK